MVFISSRSGWYGDAFVSAYSGSKFALEGEILSLYYGNHSLTRAWEPGLVEGLRWETQHLGIKTLLIEPGRFRTKLLSAGNLNAVQSKIEDYAEASTALIGGLAVEDQAQPGDTQKAVEVIVDLIRKEGCATEKDVPFRFPLGTDCYDTIKEKCTETLKLLEDWEFVIKSTDY